MNDQQQNNSFFDRNTILAIVLVGIIFFGWQQYLNKRYPEYYKKPAATTTTDQEKTSSTAETQATTSSPTLEKSVEKAGETAGLNAVNPTNETVLEYKSELLNFKLSSFGMGFKEFTLKDYLDQSKNPYQFLATSTARLFESRIQGSATVLNFNLTQKSENEFEGVAQSEAGLITKNIKIDPATAKIETKVSIQNAPTPFPGLVTVMAQQKLPSQGGSFLNPTLDHQNVTYKHSGSIERLQIADGDDKKLEHEAGSLLAIGTQYFVTGLVDKSEIAPTVLVKIPKAGEIEGQFIYKPVTIQPTMQFSWISFVGGKSLSHLQSVDAELTDVVNFGFFSIIGKLLLKILIWSHSVVGNWGWAIIMMTVLVRIVVMPFNIASYRSMKKMQTIQPLLQNLRERYKNDPAALNRESMLMMKEHKVNPLGGCLPMLLQMPVFFAFYQVLGQSIELYQSPWIFWIHDLSQKDPFFVLPVLMGLTMFIQQKITPTTMDPMQAKILQWMPVIFSAFTLALPSGLTLYIFVSTLFGVIQQRIFMRDNTKTKASAAIIEAKVEGRT